jgi:hypothetical protein
MVSIGAERSECPGYSVQTRTKQLRGAQDPPPGGVVGCVEQGDDNDEPDAARWPPGQFMDELFEADTKRFLAEARELARRRTEEIPPEDDGL